MERLDIGATFGTTFTLMWRYPLRVFGVAFLLGAIPIRLVYYGATLQFLRGYPTYIGGLEALAALMVLQVAVGGVVAGSILEGGSLARTLRMLPRLWLVGILTMLGSFLGLLLLIIPYFFVVVRWCVVASVTANERVSVIGAFARSNQLSEGARFSILGVALISTILQALIAGPLIYVLIPAVGGLPGAEDFTVAPGTVFLKLLVDIAKCGFAAALQCALYMHLRERRDGASSDRLNEIFA